MVHRPRGNLANNANGAPSAPDTSPLRQGSSRRNTNPQSRPGATHGNLTVGSLQNDMKYIGSLDLFSVRTCRVHDHLRMS